MVVISNMAIVFKTSSSKIPKWVTLCPNLDIFVSSQKFDGADYKYDNSFLKMEPKNIQIRHFWSQIKIFMFFRKILQVDKFKNADFKFDNSFWNSSSKIPK